MAQDTTLQVIELQQLPIIVERLHSVKADIERRTAEATSLICTEETYKSVKDARAQLTKEFKEYEAQRTATHTCRYPLQGISRPEEGILSFHEPRITVGLV